jgi:hypothetical protein
LTLSNHLILFISVGKPTVTDANDKPITTAAATIGTELKLKCKKGKDGTVTGYKWFRDSTVLSGKGTGGILTISPVAESDLGSYTCAAVSGTLSSEHSAAVKVTGLGKFV